MKQNSPQSHNVGKKMFRVFVNILVVQLILLVVSVAVTLHLQGCQHILCSTKLVFSCLVSVGVDASQMMQLF